MVSVGAGLRSVSVLGTRNSLLASASGCYEQTAGGGFFLAVVFFLPVDQIEPTFCGVGCISQSCSQRAERAAHVLTLLQHHWSAVIDGGRDCLIRVGNFP